MKFTMRKNGEMMTTVRIEINLTQQVVDQLKRYAKDQDMTLRAYLKEKASTGIFEDMMDSDYEFRGENDGDAEA